jgi:hypothetical protein
MLAAALFSLPKADRARLAEMLLGERPEEKEK